MENNITLNVVCVKCGTDHAIQADRDNYNSWKSGEFYIQDALRELSADEREMLISGICPACWERQFGDDE